MAGVKYPKSNWLNVFVNSAGQWEDNANITTDGLRTLATPNCYIRFAPSRYTNVTRVVFHVGLKWFENNPATTVQLKLMIGPMSTTSASRQISSVLVAPGAHVRPNPVLTTIWPVQPRNAQNANFMDVLLYSRRGPQAILNGGGVTLGVDADVQVFTITFDRDDPADSDFFDDWDLVAALGDDDLYVAYSFFPGIVETSFIAGSTANITATSFGAHVIQKPGPVNNTCTTLQCSRLRFQSIALFVLRRTAFGYPGDHPDTGLGRFRYNADEWNGITQMCLWHQMGVGLLSPANIMGLQVVRDNVPNGAPLILDTVEHDTMSGALRQDVMRSNDVKDLVQDGDTIVGDYRMEGSPGDLTMSPTQQMEIVQKSTTKTVFYMPLGGGHGNGDSNQLDAGGHYYYDRDTYWDEFPLGTITTKRYEGSLRHEAEAFLYQFFARWDTDLMGKDDGATGFSSPTAVTVLPCEINSSGQDDSINPQTVFLVCDSIVNDPLDLDGGPRKITNKTTNSITGTDDGGFGAIQYPHVVPLSDVPVIPELGPLFEIGSFNPEGCASTAAGLGDNPGILFLANGSSVPKKFNPVALNIENAGIDTPYRDEEPSTTTDSVALSPDGGLTPGIYVYRYTMRNCCTGRESDPNPVDIVVDGSGESPGLEVTLSFAGVVIPADSQICEICIYRTILGGDFPVMAKVGCFDPNDTTIFVDILPDDELDFINESLFVLNAPPPCFAVVVEFRNRLFGLVDIPNLNPPGTVSVTLGSDILEGDPDTEFDRCVLGKFIQIEGDCTAYEVIECLAPLFSSPLGGMRLLLDRDYEGATDEGLNYIICGHPNRLYISEPLEPEFWPGINFLDVDPGDGDRLMGALSNFNRLVILKRRKTYVVAFREQPITEIVVPTLISKDIGCIAPRSVAQVSSGSVWLSDRGLALYDGRGVGMIPESSVMNDLFVNPDNPNYLRRDSNGRAIGAAGVFYPKREQYLLLLPTVKTTRGASMILVWDTELRNITLLEFCQEFLSIEVAKDSDGNERVYLGDSNGFVWIWDVGDTDGVGFPNATGTVRGTITAVGIEASTGASFLTDSSASFITGGVPAIADLSGLAGTSGLTGQSNMGLAGVCVFWRSADAELGTPWQSRFIYLSTSTRLYVTPNWGEDLPSVGDDYMLGPIRFLADFKPANYGTDDFSKRDWRQVIVHEPEQVSTELRTELLRDFQNSDVDEDTVTDAAGVAGLGRTFDLGFGPGRQIRPVGRLVHQFMGVRLTNFAPEEPITILNHLLMLSPRTSK